ncbi:MAG: polysaccharide pyruvyl transferase family protein [Peptococcaceae bacterium]|jgi:polysaccharide pyruvyl transferase WcaK-like protein|nr:polysaccharide pyruvyl transferase family protein [Peptococcaceae bacterium]
MKHFVLYGHGGSYNHGGEALARCTIALLRREFPGRRVILSTHFAEQDKEFGIDADEFVERNPEGGTNAEVYAPTLELITPECVCVHLGGDNYCYPNWQRYAQIHQRALEVGAASVLWSCSIEPDATDSEMLDVLKTHHMIAARECITFDALTSRGLTNTVKVCDIAFTLPAAESAELDFLCDNYVALNLSPLITRKNPVVQSAFQNLADYILSETDYNIVLVPHVLTRVDNDVDALRRIDAHHSSRVCLVDANLPADQYKYIVSRARLCVAARTHLTIAAYSAGVPTLALGYSAKAAGIAADLDMSDYLLRIERVRNETDITRAFRQLLKHKDSIRASLSRRVPNYILTAANQRILAVLSGCG